MLPVKTMAEVLVVPEVSCANWNCTNNELCQCLRSAATTSVLYLLYLNMFYWVVALRDGEFLLFLVDHTVFYFFFFFLSLDQTDPWLMPQFTITLFGAVVTSRICLSDCFIWSLIKWLKLGEAMTSEEILLVLTVILSNKLPLWL